MIKIGCYIYKTILSNYLNTTQSRWDISLLPDVYLNIWQITYF